MFKTFLPLNRQTLDITKVSYIAPLVVFSQFQIRFTAKITPLIDGTTLLLADEKMAEKIELQ